MKVSEVCPRKEAACRREATMAEAVALLREHGTDALPVVDARAHVLGIVSERDLARGLGRPGAWADRSVADVMDRDLATCHPWEEVRHVLPLMGLLSAGRLPVVDVHDRLWGVLRIEDVLCRALSGGTRNLPAGELLDVFCRISRGERPRPAAVLVSRTPLGRSA